MSKCNILTKQRIRLKKHKEVSETPPPEGARGTKISQYLTFTGGNQIFVYGKPEPEPDSLGFTIQASKFEGCLPHVL